MTKIKAILFDMDGVLIDAKDWHYEALNKSLDLFGLKITRYEHLEIYDGLPTRQKLEMLSKEKNLPQGLHNFIYKIKQQYTVDQIFEKCKPIFSHEYALSRLKQEGYRMAVCTNAIRDSLELMMDKAALVSYFEFMVSNQDVKKSKPDPEMYNFSIKKMEVLPSETLIIEDNPNGIKAALASGAHVMQVQTINDVYYENIKNFIIEIEKREEKLCA